MNGRQGIATAAPDGELRVGISNSRFESLGSGISISSNVHAEIHDTDVFDTGRAILVNPTVGTADANLDHCTLSHNGEALFAISRVNNTLEANNLGNAFTGSYSAKWPNAERYRGIARDYC